MQKNKEQGAKSNKIEDKMTEDSPVKNYLIWYNPSIPIL
jgi:hypothetical protein